jgi:hypothetical protein
MLPDTFKNALLDSDAFDITHVSAHTAYPGTNGANQHGDRQTVAFNAASGGAKTASDEPVIAIAGGVTVAWAGFWDAAEAGNFRALSPLGAAPKAFQADVAGNAFSVLGHGYAAGQAVVFYNGAPPTGLTAGTIYYVIEPTTNTFQVAAAPGGEAIAISSIGDSTTRVSRIVPESYGSAGTLTISPAMIDLNLG